MEVCDGLYDEIIANLKVSGIISRLKQFIACPNLVRKPAKRISRMGDVSLNNSEKKVGSLLLPDRNH